MEQPRICLYCPQPLSGSTKLAHVLSDVFGGRLAGRHIECDACNQAGGTLETRFFEDLRPYYGALGAWRGDGEPVPPALVEIDGYDPMTLRAGQLEPNWVRSAEEVEPDDRRAVRVRGELEHMATLLAHRLREKRLTPDDLMAGKGIELLIYESARGR